MPHTFYISPDGNDTWSGMLCAPPATGGDGPWQSFDGAMASLARQRECSQLCGPVTVHVRGVGLSALCVA